MLSAKKYLVRLQMVIWVFSALLFYFKYKTLPMYSALYILALTITSFVAFAFIIYGYMYLYDRWFNPAKRVRFIGLISLLFIATVFLKIFFENRFVSRLTTVHLRLFYSDEQLVTPVHFTNAFGNCFFALIVGILLKSFMESMALRERQAEIQKKHLETELNLLKAQVQPHFLFNSLNNLYYDTYKTLPVVAERMAMLSDIMRYFMEESPKEKVPLSTELEFIEDFIRLEQVRLPFPLQIQFDKKADNYLLVPPMLLIPLVENVFKHGIRNDGHAQNVTIKLVQEHRNLKVVTINKVHKNGSTRTGVGLRNLRERLTLLYKNKFELDTRQHDGYFIASLTIPAYEN